VNSSEQEKAAELAARKEMTKAAAIIVGSFVLVFVAIALIVVIGHIKLF
jgi:hypothetical protein